MKTILVATDFSPASRNAFQYSLQLAQSFEAKVILLHTFQQVSIPNMESALVITLAETQSIVKARMEEEVKNVPNPGNIPVTIVYEEGPATATILEQAALLHADLIISGMKGSGKLMRHLFGSTVTDLAKLSKIPMIVVPEEASFQLPQKIALASDIAPETDLHTIDILQEIGVRFHARLFIVRVISDQFEEAYELMNRPAKFIRLSRTLDTSYEFTHNKHIANALNDFVEERGIHLLAVVPHKHGLLESWFYPSHTRSVIFTTKIPLLVLPERMVTLADPSDARYYAVK